MHAMVNRHGNGELGMDFWWILDEFGIHHHLVFSLANEERETLTNFNIFQSWQLARVRAHTQAERISKRLEQGGFWKETSSCSGELSSFVQAFALLWVFPLRIIFQTEFHLTLLIGHSSSLLPLSARNWQVLERELFKREGSIYPSIHLICHRQSNSWNL